MIEVGNQETISSPYGLPKKSRFVYDQLGRLTESYRSTVDHNWQLTGKVEYDERNNKVRETDAVGNSTVFMYDALKRPQQVLYADGQSDLFTYNDKLRITTYKDAYWHCA